MRMESKTPDQPALTSQQNNAENPGTSESESSQTNVIPVELDEAAQQRLEIITSLMEPCDRTTYGEKLR